MYISKKPTAIRKRSKEKIVKVIVIEKAIEKNVIDGTHNKMEFSIFGKRMFKPQVKCWEKEYRILENKECLNQFC